jgi:hypothetical protein
MQDNTESAAVQPGTKLKSFARRHPGLSVLGLAGIGLLGGVELAAGMLVGAGILALMQRSPKESQAVRDRARELLDRAPRELRERVRAVVQAVRGQTAPTSTEQQAHTEPTHPAGV